MTSRLRQLAVFIACAAALGAGGCGSSDKDEGPGVPVASVQAIGSQLDELRRRVDVRITGACEDAQDQNIPELQNQVDNLPQDTDPDVRSALSESIDRLSTLLDDECTNIAEQAEREKQETDTTETVPPETETQTETTPETNTETIPQTNTETIPENNGKGNGKDKDKEKDNDGGSSLPGGDGSGGVVSPE